MKDRTNVGEAVSKEKKIRWDRKQKNDIIFILTILICVALAAVLLFSLMQKGSTVVVLVDGEVWGEYSLLQDQTVEIRHGTSYNLLVIKEGEAFVQEASCPDGICSSHRPIHRDGESIICLPNRVVIEIHTNDQTHPEMIN